MLIQRKCVKKLDKEALIKIERTSSNRTFVLTVGDGSFSWNSTAKKNLRGYLHRVYHAVCGTSGG